MLAHVSRARVRAVDEGSGMAPLAMVLFITLFAFGANYFGWDDTGGHIQLALFASFLFGIVFGYKVKG
jgi:uncharacterized membrane protein